MGALQKNEFRKKKICLAEVPLLYDFNCYQLAQSYLWLTPLCGGFKQRFVAYFIYYSIWFMSSLLAKVFHAYLDFFLEIICLSSS